MHGTNEIFGHTAHSPHASEINLIARQWALTIAVLGAAEPIHAFHSIKTAPFTLTVRALATDHPRITLGVTRAARAVMPGQDAAAGAAVSREAGVVRSTHVSEDGFHSTLAPFRVTVPWSGWTEPVLSGIAGHVENQIGHHGLGLAVRLGHQLVAIEAQGYTVIPIVIEDAGWND
ncbi:hypothetical protein POX_f07832 [Penicillium oxalicum]|uniref:hypothetical protein n=1 Tax=Penicillium oxalicum TaxID=69781 RepID=UPI0020B6C576|nr:hypothetical protein POX_f07832 [Penicillium oxalicum]KAI2787467.1 hypothetical protein POX_f07832 [Penicillium oxalicum]